MSASAVVFLLIFFLGSSAALFLGPAYGLYLYVFAYFINPRNRWWWWDLPDLRFAFVIGIITLISYFIHHKEYSENRILDAPQTKWLIFFAVLISLTWFIAIDQYIHINVLLLFIKYLLLYYLIVKTIDSPQKFERLMGVFLIGQFYIGWLAYTTGRTGAGRLEGIGTADAMNSNGVANFMVVAVPILIHYLITGKKWQKICSLPILVFVLNGLILINSRGAFIALIASVTYYLFISLRSQPFPKFDKKKVIVGIIVVVVLFLYLADPLFWNRMESISNPEVDSSDSGRSRMVFWLTTFKMLKDYPLGVGAWGYEAISSKYLPGYLLTKGPHESLSRAVHSTFFQCLAEYGYHGFMLFIALLYSNFSYMKKIKTSLIQKKLYEHVNMTIALEAGLMAFLVSGVFMDRLYAEVFYMTIAFIAAYGNICFKEIKRLEKEADNKEAP